ncbi:T9SS type A sorting domain-containing protein [Flavobacterium sp. N1736]|uniref:T9SS type A sorting domain-containing protein n=1 Tax=Flavobacterium sp. N1736 TaxID=2986823 RepID=UPI0022247F10|nr:T9SS type A sorting domain-containing protein [Flavobacterium sp. N1736]
MKKMYTLIFLFTALGAVAQVDCTVKLAKAKQILDSNKLYKNYSQLFQDISSCAESGDPMAQNYVGLMYVYGMGTEKDEAKGFTYIENAAKSGNAIAQNNLAVLYLHGYGCKIDLNKAIEWFHKAIDQKNARATYLLGYMYMKGFGVPQNYKLATEWYKKSDYEMAKHWLGVCYYLGYGVPQDTEKALECFYGNKTPNSVAFLRNLKTEKRDLVLNQAENAIHEANKGDKKIDPELIADSREIVVSGEALHQNIKQKNIVGEWTGRFVEYDWSGTTPQRILPIDISLSKNEQGDLHTKIIFEGKTFENTALLKDNVLFVNDLKFKLDQLYPHDFKNEKLNFEILGMNLTLKTHNNVPYLLADIDSFIDNWREPGMPVTLVLRPKNNTVSAQDEALLLALASQKAEFIKVYPVPFNEQLYIAFDLKEPAQVQLNLISVATAQTQKVAVTNLEAGNQSFTVDTANLSKGFYIVQVQENSKVHTRTIIKK